jgi:phytoene dehydrogenase-like protein
LAKKYDHIIVGSGISGLTLAYLLSVNGKKVLLLEKASSIGGSLKRFYKNGIPFDTGFHFTGGFYKDGILYDMLSVLGIKDAIHPVFLSSPKANRFVFENEGITYDMPTGIDNLRDKLAKYFPGETAGINNYFELVKKICKNTTAMDLRKISLTADPCEEDFISLDDVLNRLIKDSLLKGFLAGYAMCYGTKPSEVSFANHARVAFGLYESVARIEGGGESFISAFKESFKNLKIDIKCNSYITECSDIKDNSVGRFVLNTKEDVLSDYCTFTLHPEEVLKVLPHKYLSRAFIERVGGFEESSGFFSVFGFVDDKDQGSFEPSIASLFPSSNINDLLDYNYKGKTALIILKSLEKINGKTYKAINAFEPSFTDSVWPWKNSFTGKRPKDYLDYKKKKTEDIVSRIHNFYPEYKDSFHIVDSASVLTFRDYLNSPYGSAYGIKQKIGQFNLFGKLPLSNIYVCGQSAVLPGLVGAMLSSFIIARGIIGKDEYTKFIMGRLCN